MGPFFELLFGLFGTSVFGSVAVPCGFELNFGLLAFASGGTLFFAPGGLPRPRCIDELFPSLPL